MKILIIGGTRFIGRHLIEAAGEKSHEITIFHRGKHPAPNSPFITEILGDRNQDLDKLAHLEWDAVIDTCGYLPQSVEASCKALKDSTEQYVYISSISAYARFSEPDFDENAPLAVLTAEQHAEYEKIDPKGEINAYALGEMYGALKVLCEGVVQKIFPQNNLIIRPGLVVGKNDWTDRFTYWVMRVSEGGRVMAPGSPDSYVQFIDARDLAKWSIKAIENGETGTFNAVGKPFGMTFGSMLEQIKSFTQSDAEFVWVDQGFMQKHGVAPWLDMPLYISDMDETRGFSAANIDRALAAGLEFRSFRDTVADILAWRKSVDGGLKAGISRSREKELLLKHDEQKTD